MPVPSSVTRFCLIRHGETDWNVEKRIQGHLDVPLNATGLAQAQATATGLAGHRFAAIYSSDLTRAVQTAQAAAEKLGQTVFLEPGLRERHYGRLQGLTSAEIAKHHPEDHARYLARDEHCVFGQGESLRALATRIAATLERLAVFHRGQNVLCVAHGGVLDVIYRRATGRSLSAPRDFVVPNCALNWLTIRLPINSLADADWQIETWADRRHLVTTLEESE